MSANYVLYDLLNFLSMVIPEKCKILSQHFVLPCFLVYKSIICELSQLHKLFSHPSTYWVPDTTVSMMGHNIYVHHTGTCYIFLIHIKGIYMKNVYIKEMVNLMKFIEGSVQFSSVTQSCPTLCDPMNRSTPGLSVHHQLPEFTQTHVHRIGDAIQPSHPLSSPFPPAPNTSQHHFMANTWGISGKRDRLYFGELENHCS